jgi:hypothetical protein
LRAPRAAGRGGWAFGFGRVVVVEVFVVEAFELDFNVRTSREVPDGVGARVSVPAG